MDRIIYTAMSGAKQALDNQAVISNNLANASTTGFRAEMMSLRAVDMQGESALNTRTLVALHSYGTDFTGGPIHSTGREMDIAIDGNGWLAVLDADGAEAYTRRGDIQTDVDGFLTVGGLMVMGDGGPIQIPPGSELFIGSDGTLSAIGEGEAAEAIAQLGRLKLVQTQDEALVRGVDGLFRTPADAFGNTAPLPLDETVTLVSGALEGSNVNAVSSMVEMIANARYYEMQMQMIKSVDENEQMANGLLSVNS